MRKTTHLDLCGIYTSEKNIFVQLLKPQQDLRVFETEVDEDLC